MHTVEMSKEKERDQKTLLVNIKINERLKIHIIFKSSRDNIKYKGEYIFYFYFYKILHLILISLAFSFLLYSNESY